MIHHPGIAELGASIYSLESGEKPTDLHAYIPTIYSSVSPPVDGLDGLPYAYVFADMSRPGQVVL